MRAGLASVNLGELEYGVSTEEQLLEVLGDINKDSDFFITMTGGGRTRRSWRLHFICGMSRHFSLDRADINDNADNARLDIILSCDLFNDETKLWRSWRRTRIATWTRSDQRRQTAVHHARGNTNMRTTS